MDESPDNGSDTFGNESAELQRWPYVTNLIDADLLPVMSSLRS